MTAINEAAAEYGQDVPAEEVTNTNKEMPEDAQDLVTNNQIGIKTVLTRSFVGSKRYFLSSYHVRFLATNFMCRIRSRLCDGVVNRIFSSHKRQTQEHQKSWLSFNMAKLPWIDPTWLRAGLRSRRFYLTYCGSILQQALLDHIIKDEIFGKVKTYSWAVETQKRGNLHVCFRGIETVW